MSNITQLPLNTPTVMTITPEVAQIILNRRAPNRSITPDHVNAFASAIREGDFSQFQMIKFNPEGHMTDGQHRMTAVVQTGQPQQFTIIRTDDPNDQAATDAGRSRSAGDVLAINGYSSAKWLAVCTKVIVQMRDAGSFGGWYNAARKSALNSTLLREVQSNESIIDIANFARTCYTGATENFVPPRLVFAFVYWLVDHGTARAAITQFFDEIRSGVGLQPGSPTLVFRNTRDDMRRLSKAMRVQRDDVATVYLIRAWNAWIGGRSISKLQAPRTEGGSFPEPTIVQWGFQA